MGKVFNFFVLFGEFVGEMRDFLEILKELNLMLKGLREDLEKESVHRETVYRLLIEDALRRKSQ